MGVPNSHLTPNFVSKYRVSNNCVFLPNYQLTVNPIGTLLDCLEHLDYLGTDDKGPPWDCALDVFDKSGIACGAMLSNPGPRVPDFSTRKVFSLIL